MITRLLVAAIVIIPALAALPSGRVAAQPVPRLEDVPDSMSEGQRTPLRIVHTKLAAMRDDLRRQAAAHNARCGSVEVGSAADPACREDRARFMQQKEQYARAVDKFNEMVREFAGENLGTDLEKWRRAIHDGHVRAAIDKALAAATRRGELTESQAAAIANAVGAATVIEDGGRRFLAQRVVVPGPPGKPAVVDTYTFAELNEGETAASAAHELLRAIASDTRIMGRAPSQASQNPK